MHEGGCGVPIPMHELITGACKQLALKKEGKGRGELVFDSVVMGPR